METILPYIKAFVVGGILCVIGQLLIDKTNLTPARILTAYVVAGVVLGAVGIYQPLADFAGAGATVPLTGFGNLLARGVKKAVEEKTDVITAYVVKDGALKKFTLRLGELTDEERQIILKGCLINYNRV